MEGPASVPSSATGSGISLANIVSAVPDVLFAAQFLLMWIAPGVIGASLLPGYGALMLVEFVVIHSSVFMGNLTLSTGTRSAKARSILLLGLFYSLFVGAFSLAFGSWLYLAGFWLLIGNRLLSILLVRAPLAEEKRILRASWVVSVGSYLAAVFATVVLPIPRLGVTNEVIAANPLPGEGLWVEEPQRFLAAGFIYFALVAWAEVRGFSMIPASSTSAGDL